MSRTGQRGTRSDVRGDSQAELRADVVVVGAGPAGITAALEAARAGLRVVLVPGGGKRESAGARGLNSGEDALGPWPHEPLSENRRRMVGGTSSAWGGRCVPLDPIDFQKRDWVPDSGWPISFDEYWRFADAAAHVLGIGRPQFNAAATAGVLSESTPLAAGGIEGIDESTLERWSPPVKFARLLQSDASLRRHCHVLLDHHVVDLQFEGSRVAAIVVRTLNGASRTVRGRHYVLATGALENARLLLRAGLDRELPAIGRYYMAHTFGTIMPVRLNQPLPAAADLCRDHGIYARRRIRLSDALQEKARVGNAVAYFGWPPVDAAALHRNPMTSTMAIAREVVGAARRGPRGGAAQLREQRDRLLQHAGIVARGDAAFWRDAVSSGLKRVGRHRRPLVSPSPHLPIQFLTFQGEHAPRRDSRVALGRDRDALGVPRLGVQISFGEQDFDTIAVLHQAIETAVQRRGGEVLRSPEDVVVDLRKTMEAEFNSNAHHIGTTRMGISRETSVVDANSKVHGVDNLFVAGSSVFPTGGHANPTFSIVALSLRLGEHLTRLR